MNVELPSLQLKMLFFGNMSFFSWPQIVQIYAKLDKIFKKNRFHTYYIQGDG